MPLLTVIATGVAVVAAVVQYAAPAVIPALERTPSGLDDGEWWRLVTPVLVQTLGWHQVVANLVTLAVVGMIGESLLRRRWWLLCFGSGIVGGQVAAYAWQEFGGGSSVAICGLAGGVATMLLLRRRQPATPAVVLVAGYVAMLAGWGMGGVPLAALSVLASSGAYLALKLALGGIAERVVLAAAIACSIGLAALRDLHGASLASGILVAGLVFVVTWRRGR